MLAQGKLRFRLALRILGSIALIGYLIFIFGEIPYLFNGENPEIQESPFGISMVFILIGLFLLGYFYIWKNEKLAGLLWIFWYAVLLVTALWIWIEGDLTVIIGFPIFILGILLVVYNRISIKKKGRS